MHINAVGNTYNTNNNHSPNFQKLIKDKTALPIIKSMSKSDKLEFRKFEKRLAKTKFWDLKISGIGDKFKEFKFKFINKKDKNNVITDGIYPYSRDKNAIRYYSIVYGPENTPSNNVEKLSFKSEKRAEELYDKYNQNTLYTRNRGYNITPLESLKMKEVELRMLEEAAENKTGHQDIIHVSTELKTKYNVGNDLSYKD